MFLTMKAKLPARERSPIAPGDYLVRRAVRKEAPEISSLIEASLAGFKGDLPDAILRSYVAYSRNIAARWDDGEVLVALQYGRILGTVTLHRDASNLGLPLGWASFGTLAVHPRMQGRGVGSLLTRTCVAAVRDAAPTIGIHSGGFMRPARRLYESMGFMRCPTLDLLASDFLGISPGAGNVEILAYRLDLSDTLSDPAIVSNEPLSFFAGDFIL
jgi:GNAT superfamily N-acetyltransferase